MAWRKFNWRFALVFYLVTLSALSKSLPVEKTKSLVTQDVVSRDASELLIDNKVSTDDVTEEKVETSSVTSLLTRNVERPGQTVTQTSVSLSIGEDSFSGTAIISVTLTATTREDDIVFMIGDINIESVQYGILTLTNPTNANYFVNDTILYITPSDFATSYIFLITYSNTLGTTGNGLYKGSYGDSDYVAMNLHPTHARHVFPCMDDPTYESTYSFVIDGMSYGNVFANAIVESSNTSSEITAIQSVPHRLGFIANDFTNILNPAIDVRLYVRPGVTGQENQASVIINSVYSTLAEWTERSLLEVQTNQAEKLNVIALPDITKKWVSLSNIPVWEPYILMETSHAVEQRKTAIVSIAEAFANQYFGYILFPENWRYDWLVSGLAGHAAYEAARAFQEDSLDTDFTVIDMNTIFFTDVIQESLYHDGYSMAFPLEPTQDLLLDVDIRRNVNGLVNKKATAIMWFLKSLLQSAGSDESVDHIQYAARAMLQSRALQSIYSLNFVDAIKSQLSTTNDLFDDFEFFLSPWVQFANYPIVNVQMRSSGVVLTQERFCFGTPTSNVDYEIPITYTTSVNPNFENTEIQAMLVTNAIIDLYLDDDDWVLVNIQGQGYYRVNYDSQMWERIIDALWDPDRRAVIHPNNRATLVDDALNLARAGNLEYDIALEVALTMSLETEYAVWKAYIRNMNFIRKRFDAMMVIDEDEIYDRDIYLRLLRRVITAVENEIGFSPDINISESAMTSMTRGIVMEHACKVGYEPCVAAAIDWFYGDTVGVVNTEIPHDIRPAVYCTMMREGGSEARTALLDKYESTTSLYERLVIVRALACTDDAGYINGLLQQMANGADGFGVEERVEFLKALIDSSYDNAMFALIFLRGNTAAIRTRFGGDDKLEELINLVAENIPDFILLEMLETWTDSLTSNLGTSLETSLRGLSLAQENLIWNNNYMLEAYEWIDENDGNTFFVSLTLFILSTIFSVIMQ